jgi:hypothetical protein
MRAFNVYAMHAPGRYPDAKVRTLIDYLRMTIPDALASMQRDLDDMTAAHAQTALKPGAPKPLLRVVERAEPQRRSGTFDARTL